MPDLRPSGAAGTAHWARPAGGAHAVPEDHADGRMLAEVAAGLALPQKELPPKYFYDQRGSELFEEVTRLPEYYLTRTERMLLRDWMPSLVPSLGIRTVVELGAGSADKTRTILDAMRASGTGKLYVPIDVSATFLKQTATQLRREYPKLAVEPVVGDISEELRLPRWRPRPALFAFLGSTIGNFAPAGAIRLLRRVRAAMAPGDRFLMGVDLRPGTDAARGDEQPGGDAAAIQPASKDAARIEAAYNDRGGVTAAFNRNMLLVVNHELGANFRPELFEHRAFYEPVAHRIEMHLVSTRDQRVSIPGIGEVAFRHGESIRTEISCKHDRASIAELFEAAGLRLEAWRTDPEALFALAVGAPA